MMVFLLIFLSAERFMWISLVSDYLQLPRKADREVGLVSEVTLQIESACLGDKLLCPSP